MTKPENSGDWWRQAVVYQVYPRSFKDADGDGLGDLRGITSEMPYLRRLGVDAVWLSPFYPSPLADGGYDVTDYRDVDPRLGTIADFDGLVAAAHASGLKIIVDIVPNHSSDRHPWFREALTAGRGTHARERYIFRDGRGGHGELPPNEWLSMFGGPAWKRVDDGQWYLHLFTEHQPDFNWKNPEVHSDFLRTLRFWSDHGVDGFRVDTAHGLAKDLTSIPLAMMDRRPVLDQSNPDGNNPLWDRPEVHDIYREWRQVFNTYTPHKFAVAEAWVVPEHQYLYASPEELGQVFNFEFAKANWTHDQMRAAINSGLRSAGRSGSTTTWVMSNHDMPRHASRYGLPQVAARGFHQIAADWLLRDGTSYIENRALGTRRARAAIMLELGLPGSVYIYQGEELGLFEVADIPWDRLEDPMAFHTTHSASSKGRDGCRVPLPWDSGDAPQPASWCPHFGTGASFGFSPRVRADGSPPADPHLPQPRWFKAFAVNREQDDPASMLSLYQRALAIRARRLAHADGAALDWLDDQYPDAPVIAYARRLPHISTTATGVGTGVGEAERRNSGKPAGTFICVTNFGRESVRLPGGTVLLTSTDLDHGLLPVDATAWILR